MFSVEKAIITKANMENYDCYIILNNDLPVFFINKWLDMKALKSDKTSKKYAYDLCRFLNFLNQLNKTYLKATKKDVLLFIDSVLFQLDDNVSSISSNISYNTAYSYLNTIKEFYKYVEDYSDEASIEADKYKKKSAKNSFLYGQIWDMNIKDILLLRTSRIKGNKDYLKWYTDKEKSALIMNFKTLRDKTIFLLTLEGMRIDEVLSLTLANYDPVNALVTTNRSKSKDTRTIPLSDDTVQAIEDYLFNERSDVEINCDTPTEYLFLNLKRGRYFGKEVSYNNFLTVLKKASSRAGLDPAKIRTHSGRSSKTMELLTFQAEHPEINLTDEQIRLLMGWENVNSIKPYINYKDERILLAVAKKINEIKNGEGENNGKNND